jgi:hypothetical protein
MVTLQPHGYFTVILRLFVDHLTIIRHLFDGYFVPLLEINAFPGYDLKGLIVHHAHSLAMLNNKGHWHSRPNGTTFRVRVQD